MKKFLRRLLVVALLLNPIVFIFKIQHWPMPFRTEFFMIVMAINTVFILALFYWVVKMLFSPDAEAPEKSR